MSAILLYHRTASVGSRYFANLIFTTDPFIASTDHGKLLGTLQLVQKERVDVYSIYDSTGRIDTALSAHYCAGQVISSPRGSVSGV